MAPEMRRTMQQRTERSSIARIRRQRDAFTKEVTDLIQYIAHAGHVDQMAGDDDTLNLLGTSGVD